MSYQACDVAIRWFLFPVSYSSIHMYLSIAVPFKQINVSGRRLLQNMRSLLTSSHLPVATLLRRWSSVSPGGAILMLLMGRWTRVVGRVVRTATTTRVVSRSVAWRGPILLLWGWGTVLWGWGTVTLMLWGWSPRSRSPILAWWRGSWLAILGVVRGTDRGTVGGCGGWRGSRCRGVTSALRLQLMGQLLTTLGKIHNQFS